MFRYLTYQFLQGDLCLSEAAKLEEIYPHLKTSAALVKAAQYGKMGKLDEVMSILQKTANENPTESTFIKLATAQILMSQVS